ncbi:hypothetical protein LguiB_020502 [Lonicera macranthoides]
MWKIGLYIALSGVAFGISIAIGVAFILMQWKKRKIEYITNTAKDVELQQLRLSVIMTSEKKVSFEDSQDPFEAQIIEPTPRKVAVEAFTLEELRKATKEFSSSNLIEDSIFYGRLNGKNINHFKAPEYLHHGVTASSINIFSYGVILLEVLSGQLPISRNSEKRKGSVWLSKKIKFNIQTDNAEELRGWMDNALGENYSFNAAITIANIVRACVEDDMSL